MSAKEDLKIIDKIKEKIKSSDTIKEIFKKEKKSLDLIDYMPMCFAPLEVSARTQHGIIYFNEKLRKHPEEIDHYMVHEITHVLQQCFADGPTQGSTAKTYLDNPYEQEGFKNQTKFITEEDGPKAAKKYIDKVLEHHDVPEEEKEDKKDALLSTSSTEDRLNYYKFAAKQLSLFPSEKPKSIEQEPSNYPMSYAEGFGNILKELELVERGDPGALERLRAYREEDAKRRAESYGEVKRPKPIDPESRARIDALMKHLEEIKKNRPW
jgi:hypothetical protein